jgi:hypothetical protein
MHMLIGIGVLAVAGLFLLGWLAPLVIGIRLSSRRRGGTALIVGGGVWGAASIGLFAMGAMFVVGFRTMSSSPSDPNVFEAADHGGPQGLIRTAGTGATSLTVTDESGVRRSTCRSLRPTATGFRFVSMEPVRRPFNSRSSTPAAAACGAAISSMAEGAPAGTRVECQTMSAAG